MTDEPKVARMVSKEVLAGTEKEGDAGSV